MDKEYYRMLNVPVDATPAEILKAYRNKNNNNNDEDANEKFQKLSSVYKFLSDKGV